MKVALLRALEVAKRIQADAPSHYLPPPEGTKPRSQNILPNALVAGTRGYIEKIAFQINGSYEKGWFDACAVMMRRLLETLIIECFVAHQIEHKIQDPSSGDFLAMSALVSKTLSESSFNLTRNTKKALRNGIKAIGDLSAHSRKFTAYQTDIDKLSLDFRVACQELLSLSSLK